MFKNMYLILLFIVISIISGCASAGLMEVITCDPPNAQVYWGKDKSALEFSERVTPYSRSISGSSWESWCYQARKEGYKISETICKPGGEDYRHISFQLTPLKTTITSEPDGAVIYWGTSKDDLEKTLFKTPRIESNISRGVNYKAYYFQVKKGGYRSSEIIFLPQSDKDRDLHFELNPLSKK